MELIQDLDKQMLNFMIEKDVPDEEVEAEVSRADDLVAGIIGLKSRFGREDVLIEVYVRELLKLILNNLNSKMKVTHLYDQIESRLRSLETLGINTDKCAAMLYPLVESCLSEDLLRVWQRSNNYDTEFSLKLRLEKLMEFLRKEVENEEKNFVSYDRNHATIMCQRNENISDTTSDNAVSGASTSTENFIRVETLTNTTPDHTFLQTLCVNICGNGKSVVARAIIDTGSQRSYITKKIAEKIAVDHRCYEVTLKNLESNYTCIFNALDQLVICSSLIFIHDGPWKQELIEAGIVVSDLKDGPIEILLGADVAGITDPETRKINKEAERETMKKFSESILVNAEGRYEVGLAWLVGHPPLPNNFVTAKKRLDNLRKKLDNDGLFSMRQQKEKNHPSLNQCLDKGINLIELIPSILIRFRLHRIGVIADIRKAFLQISLKEEDRIFLRFLWYNQKQELKCFQHGRVVFGLTCSPFHLAVVIKYHLEKQLNAPKQKYNKNILLKLVNGFYVDNCVVSLENEDELHQFIKESSEVTKEAHRMFDPIGFSCPIQIIPRILLRRTWLLKLKWDDEVPEEIRNDFLLWIMWITGVYTCFVMQAKSLCVVFLCSGSNEDAHIQLIQAKNRISPIKKLTIPRLELLAATIGARLLTSVIENFNKKDLQIYCWTDSTTVLSWIRREDMWKPFIWNRIQEIRSLTEKNCWFHVPGHMNPADLPSRGCSPKELLLSRWWEGLMWLKDKRNWPKQSFETNEEEILNEKRKDISLGILDIKVDYSMFYRYFSKYQKNLNQIAWIRRFIFNCQHKEKREKMVGNTYLQKKLRMPRIKWKFNPPGAAWWGGWWERVIRILKNLLRRQLGKASISFEELYTIICDCEAVINSRPLTYISETSEDLLTLTPAMFLQDIRENGVPDLDNIGEVSLKRRARYLLQVREALRKRFRKEYLSQLVLFSFNRDSNRHLTDYKLGDVVIIETENLKRFDWPLGVIEEIFPAKMEKVDWSVCVLLKEIC
ncbi:hypothetical protein NQ317_017929 [Molorchus minor]|uniref:DUF5641 domain-containing protein n=1 Tax=Molorchus minor TaxID=1323400 RepID=A0ABQ9J4W5_9CUCU|nr:hypothetical protein NQ317_017929 [Molorchus minor]